MTEVKNNSFAIGVFDSGLGGLTVVRAIRKLLPNENIHYFGDIARLPYGIKSRKQIIEFSKQNTGFLIKKKIKALVVACNSSASASLPSLQKNFDVPIIDVITPAAQLAADVTTSGRIGIIGTAATVESGTYQKEIQQVNHRIQVIQTACPLFVPLVEAGWLDNPITESIVRKYLKPFIGTKVDTIILGCTHYPLLHRVIKRVVGKNVALIDSAPSTTKRLKEVLDRRGLLAARPKQKGKLKIYVSDLPRNFIGIGERFLGHKIQHIETVPI